jgi:hypothetical protein
VIHYSTPHVKWKNPVENGTMLPGVNFPLPNLNIPCVGNTILGKLSLIQEENAKQILQPWL